MKYKKTKDRKQVTKLTQRKAEFFAFSQKRSVLQFIYRWENNNKFNKKTEQKHILNTAYKNYGYSPRKCAFDVLIGKKYYSFRRQG